MCRFRLFLYLDDSILNDSDFSILHKCKVAQISRKQFLLSAQNIKSNKNLLKKDIECEIVIFYWTPKGKMFASLNYIISIVMHIMPTSILLTYWRPILQIYYKYMNEILILLNFETYILIKYP